MKLTILPTLLLQKIDSRRGLKNCIALKSDTAVIGGSHSLKISAIWLIRIFRRKNLSAK